MANIRLEEHLCFSVYSTWGAINRAYKPVLDALDLTYTQYIILVALWEQDNQNVKRLGEHLYLGSNTLTPVIKKLESKGLLVRVRDTGDDRVVNVALTEQGRSMSTKAARVPFCIPDLTGLPIDHLIQLRDQIQDLRQQVNTACTPQGEPE